MAKENMLTYLEKTLESNLKKFDFAIDWNSKTHSIEVLVALFAENTSSETIEDDEGVQSNEEYIEFEDSILLYESGQALPDESDYLAIIEFDRKKGMEKRIIHAIGKHLNEVLEVGQKELQLFLTDETIEGFELKWDTDTFLSYVQSESDQSTVSYPKY